MKKTLLTIPLLLIVIFTARAQQRIVVGTPTADFNIHNVYGKVVSKKDRSTLPGVNVFIKSLNKGVSTDEDGNFIIRLKKGDYTLSVTFIGYKETIVPIRVVGDGRLLIKLEEDLTQLEEVVVTGQEPDANVRSTDIGRASLTIESIKELPPFLGEVDILKTITLLPGVATVGEASSGFNVRGGGVDQNLILLGGAPLYNPTHLFGLYSAFNSELVDNLSLYKGGIPPKYGGRSASILDISYKDGSLTNWSGSVSAGTVSSKISADGPIIKDKLSLSVGGRVSYINYLLNMVKDPSVANSAAFFFDGNVIATYQINDNNKIKYSFYQSGDEFRLASDTAYAWQNQGHVLSWKHSFSDNLTMDLSLVRSKYDFAILNKSKINSFSLRSGILDDGANLDFDWEINDKNDLSFGIQTKLLRINPGILEPGDANSPVNPKTLETEKGHESAIYLQHEIELGKNLAVSYGLRFNLFRYLGPKTVSEYEEYLPLSNETRVSDTFYGSNELVKQFSGFEPRASLRWAFNSSTSFKLGYNRMYQYIQVISNTTTIAPTDIWKLSDSYLDPQIVDQFSVGIFKNFSDNGWETSIEGYYKNIYNVIEYKDGAQLLLNDNLETELLSGRGQAYGAELFIKKKYGRLTGWLSYTYSRSLRLVDGAYPITRVNNGDWYPANFDKPHIGTVVTNYKINPLVSFSAIFTYSTGRPVTYPSAKFSYEATDIAYFDNRNQNRAPDYHRLDLSLTFAFPAKKKILQGEWVVAVYNVYGRKNAYSVFFDDVQGFPPQAFQLAVLGVPFPSLSYTVKF